MTQTALRMIKAKGKTVTWRSMGNPQLPDPDKPWNPGHPPVSVDYQVEIVFLPNERYGREVFRYFDKTDIPIGNLLGFMGRVNFQPSLKDIILDNGREIAILGFNEYNPDGNGVILYTLELDGVKSV
jgi:hypothetical protein